MSTLDALLTEHPSEPGSAVLAIDPGSERSAWVLYADGFVWDRGKADNETVLRRLVNIHWAWTPVVVIEWMSPRGMPTSAQEMEAMWWAGRFGEAASRWTRVERLTRDAVKLHLTGQRARVRDSNVRAALIDRFGGVGGKAAAVGVKASPGPLYGVKADEWAALAVAVTWSDGAR